MVYLHWSRYANASITEHSLRCCKFRGAFIELQYCQQRITTFWNFHCFSFNLFIAPLETDSKFVNSTQCYGSGMFIPDPGSDFFPSGSRILKEFKYFNPQKIKKMVSKLLKIWSGLFIPDPGSGCWLSTHPGSQGQKGTQSRIPDPDPQHW